MKFLIQEKIQPDWWSKSFAGWILGLTLAIACASLLTLWATQQFNSSLASQLGMWSVPWLYLPLLLMAYFIPKGWQALLMYSVLNGLVYGMLLSIRG